MGVTIALVLALSVFWHHSRSLPVNAQSGDLEVVGQTEKSMFSGRPPHEFAGEIAEDLSHLSTLPQPAKSDPSADTPSLDELIANVSAQSSVSTLRLVMLPPDKAEGAPAGIVFSLRADCVRPSQFHVSQASWNGERSLYEMDEWVEKSGKLFSNFSIWADMTEDDIADRRKEVNTGLRPEETLKGLQEDKIATKTQINIYGIKYFVIEMKPVSEAGSNASAKTTLWIDVPELLVKKVATEYSENGLALFTEIATFSNYGSSELIRAPKWMNMDANSVIVRTDVDAVEHW